MLPDAEEHESFGNPVYRVAGKTFAQQDASGNAPAVLAPAPPGAQEMLADIDPAQFFVPRYLGPRGWIGMRLDGADWGQVAGVVLDAYRHVSSKRQAARLDSPAFGPAALAAASLEAAKGMTMPEPPFSAAAVADAERQLTAICGSLPEVTATGGPHPGYRVNGKAFAWLLVNHHGDRRLALSCKVPPGAQGPLVDSAPDRYFLPQYMAHHGWVGLRLESGADWDEVRTLVEESYRLIAPKRLAALLLPPPATPVRRQARTH